MPNATNEFDDAVNRGDASYDPTSPIDRIYDSVRWPTVAQGFVNPSLEAAVQAADQIFSSSHILPMLTNSTTSGRIPPDGIRLMLQGIQARTTDMHPFTPGIRFYLNTVGMVFPAIISFFFSLAIRGSPARFGPSSTRINYLYRMTCGLTMSCLAGISYGLWYEAFHETFTISGGQYCLIWVTVWLYSFVSYVVYDTLTGFTAFMPWPPPMFMPPYVLLYIIINVSSTVFPIEIKPQFYRLDYIWPAHNCYELIISIITHGGSGRVYRNVPILFGWIVIWLPLNWFMNWRMNRLNLRQAKFDPKLVDRLLV